MAEATQTQSTGIVARIMRILKLDDAGKVQSFFDREKKKLSRDITTLNKNIENVKFNSERTLDEYREKLEDAEVALENAYAGVTLADIENNAKQEEFSGKYWYAIDVATEKVENIKKRIKDETENTEKSIESFEKQIEELKFRISKIS